VVQVAGARNGQFALVDRLQELLVALGSGKYDIDPYPHCLRTGRHQVQRPVSRLDTERQRRVGTADRLTMIDVDVLDRLEGEGTARRGPRLQLVGVVVETSPTTVEHEPATVPRAQFAAHLGQVAVTGARRHLDVSTLGQVVAGRLNKLTQVQRCLTDRQIARQRARRQRSHLHAAKQLIQSLNRIIGRLKNKMHSLRQTADG